MKKLIYSFCSFHRIFRNAFAQHLLSPMFNIKTFQRVHKFTSQKSFNVIYTTQFHGIRTWNLVLILFNRI